MSGRGQICWNRRDEESGEKFQIYAEQTGDKWSFFIRHRRFDQWAPHPEPPLEDWLELLDGVERRVLRRLQPPEAVVRIRKLIRERFPEA
ncbi:MAG TPA: hypothetical protein DCM86_04265, partial [Verrucomicrobiales bacterium]|nr:hypothetical protein [Verrucomicrobiales bacterium]